MLDVKRLRILRAVAEHGSFKDAAEALSYSQPRISQQIAALERETGTTLLDRGPRGVRLTDAGRALVQHSDAILARVAAAEAELEAIAGLRGGRVRLASFPTAGAALVPPAIAMFSRRHPAVELSLIEAEPEDALPRLKEGELDVALVFEYDPVPGSAYEQSYDGLDLKLLLEDPMYVALPREHRLAGRARVRLEDLATDVWAQGDRQGMCGAMQISACNAAGFEPRITFGSGDYNVVQGLVAAGVAISLLPEMALHNCRDDIVVRPLERPPLRRVMAATLTGAYRSPATVAMLEVLEEVAEDYKARRGAHLAVAAG
jgi:DNA-binding transcriptional LysR family regulator